MRTCVASGGWRTVIGGFAIVVGESPVDTAVVAVVDTAVDVGAAVVDVDTAVDVATAVEVVAVGLIVVVGAAAGVLTGVRGAAVECPGASDVVVVAAAEAIGDEPTGAGDCTVNTTTVPGGLVAIRASTSSTVATLTPSMAVIRSPTTNPARAAGLPGAMTAMVSGAVAEPPKRTPSQPAAASTGAGSSGDGASVELGAG